MLEWNNALSVGIDIIDDDHRALFDLLKTLKAATESPMEAWRIPRAIDALGDYARIHFQREEALLLLCGYEQLPRHQEEHQKFHDVVAKLKSLYEVSPPLISAAGLNQFLINWLTDHIAISDHSYVGKVHQCDDLIKAATANLSAKVSP